MKKFFTKEVLIGISVTVAIVILVFGIHYLKGINVLKAANYYYATFSDVEGMDTSAPVMLNGYKVGEVREIIYDYEHPGNIKVEVSLDKALRVPQGSKAILTTDLLGTASIVLSLGEGPAMLNIGDDLIPEIKPGLVSTLSSEVLPNIGAIFTKIDTLLTSINAIASDPALRESAHRLDAITADLQTTTKNIAAITAQLNPTVAKLNPILADVKDITGNVGVITEDVQHLTGNMRNLPLDSLMQNLQTTTENLRALSAQLNDPNSSLGLLMKDPALYNNINNAVASLDSIFVDLKKNPKRYISIKMF